MTEPDLAIIAMTEDRLEEGMAYAIDIDTGEVVQNRTYSEDKWVNVCEQTPSTNPATLENPDDRSDFMPILAVARGYCPGVGLCIIRATRTGQIEYEPLGT